RLAGRMEALERLRHLSGPGRGGDQPPAAGRRRGGRAPARGGVEPGHPPAAPRAAQVVGLANLGEVAVTPALRELVERLGVRSLALVPLLSRGRFLGLLALCWTERHQLDREQEALLGLAGNQIAGALEAGLRLEEAERAAGEARAVFYAIADGVLLTDPFGRVTAMNRALEALTGWTEAEARGRPYGEVLPSAIHKGGGCGA